MLVNCVARLQDAPFGLPVLRLVLGTLQRYLFDLTRLVLLVLEFETGHLRELDFLRCCLLSSEQLLRGFLVTHAALLEQTDPLFNPVDRLTPCLLQLVGFFHPDSCRSVNLNHACIEIATVLCNQRARTHTLGLLCELLPERSPF